MKIECSICFENIGEDERQVSVTRCGHLFHNDCVKSWMNKSNGTSCPDCRHALHATDLRTVFFNNVSDCSERDIAKKRAVRDDLDNAQSKLQIKRLEDELKILKNQLEKSKENERKWKKESGIVTSMNADLKTELRPTNNGHSQFMSEVMSYVDPFVPGSTTIYNNPPICQPNRPPSYPAKRPASYSVEHPASYPVKHSASYLPSHLPNHPASHLPSHLLSHPSSYSPLYQPSYTPNCAPFYSSSFPQTIPPINTPNFQQTIPQIYVPNFPQITPPIYPQNFLPNNSTICSIPTIDLSKIMNNTIPSKKKKLATRYV